VTSTDATATVDSILPFHVLIESADSGLRDDSKAQAEQVRSIAVSRVGDLVGVVPRRLMHLVDEALRLHLDL
jgi:mRNA interferase MazF